MKNKIFTLKQLMAVLLSTVVAVEVVCVFLFLETYKNNYYSKLKKGGAYTIVLPITSMGENYGYFIADGEIGRQDFIAMERKDHTDAS